MALKESQSHSRRRRRRGEYDYQFVLWDPHYDIYGLPDFLTIKNSDLYDRVVSQQVTRYFNKHWVQIVTPASAFTRHPNYRAVDRAVQASDGAILVIPRFYNGADYCNYYFNRIKAAYEGSYAGTYGEYLWKIEAPAETELSLMESMKRRPVSVILWDPAPETRKNFADLAAKHPKLRHYEYKPKNGLQWDDILADMIEDVKAGRGMEFSPPTTLPWEAPNKQYKTLDIVKKNENKSGFWKSFIGALVGH